MCQVLRWRKCIGEKKNRNVIYRILAQLLVGANKTPLLGPVNKHLFVRHNYSYNIRLET